MHSHEIPVLMQATDTTQYKCRRSRTIEIPPKVSVMNRTLRPRRLRKAPLVAILPLFLLAALPVAAQAQSSDAVAVQEAEARYALPPSPVAEFFERDPSYAVLDAPSPDGRFFLVPTSTELSTLELMSRPTLRLAELELRPDTDRLWHLDTYGIIGLRVYDLEGQVYRDIQTPRESFLSDLVWSPDGATMAFLAHRPEGTEVWTADPASGEASRLSEARILATMGTQAQTSYRPSRMVQWTPEGTILTLMVPLNRGVEPARNPVPEGPIVRMTRPEPTPTRTFPNLLRDPHDAVLFEHYTRAQLVELSEGANPRILGEPRMYQSIALSPDGRHILATYLERPFSFITSHQGFPRSTSVLDREGRLVSVLEERPLREGRGGDDDDGPRAFAWRPDGAGLSYLHREPGEEENGNGADRVMALTAPFDLGDAAVVARSDDPIRSVTFTRDGGWAVGTVTRSGRSALVGWGLESDAPERLVLVDFHHPDSVLTRPGDLWTGATGNGVGFAFSDSGEEAVYLRGDGHQPDFRPRPFVDRVALSNGDRTRIFEGSTDHWERPLVPLDPDLQQMIVSREGVDLYPDSYLWSRNGSFVNLTENEDPFPELAAARRIDFSFNRRDGLEVQGRISLPIGYRDGDKVPAIFWTYPREFTTPEGYTRASLQARNRNAFTHLTWLRWSELWLTQGYALVYPDIPIVGENYNDTYISNMVDAMYGAMRAVEKLGMVDMDRIGHGGHSYGAFATANLLAHTPFFRAGIAGHGAYNRTLTPSGFQAESRHYWSAPSTYLDISPFLSADQINTPLLMYHGGDDNNTGTWPMQSERLIHALTTLGKDAVLYMYPYESHTPRAIENNLDMWARWLEWFNQHLQPVMAEDGQDERDGS
jgi:dipeptidyl aminopeptidase/acylaminoacyl peptidase